MGNRIESYKKAIQTKNNAHGQRASQYEMPISSILPNGVIEYIYVSIGFI